MGASPTPLPVISMARISSVCSPTPMWILRQVGHPPHQWLTLVRPVLGLVARRDGSAHAYRLPRWIHEMTPSIGICATRPGRRREDRRCAFAVLIAEPV